jgi:hypothetical protein
MDRAHFDALAQLVSTRQSRRSALAAVLGAAVLRLDPAAVLAKGRHKGNGRLNAQAKAKAKTKAKPCYTGTTCALGKGKNASGCDFTGSTALFQGDFRGANLSNSNFSGAQLAQADFRGANLSNCSDRRE